MRAKFCSQTHVTDLGILVCVCGTPAAQHRVWGGDILSKRRCTWSESSGKTNESCDLSGKVERIGAVESGGDCNEA